VRFNVSGRVKILYLLSIIQSIFFFYKFDLENKKERRPGGGYVKSWIRDGTDKIKKNSNPQQQQKRKKNERRRWEEGKTR
jgi:hypothetical protein